MYVWRLLKPTPGNRLVGVIGGASLAMRQCSGMSLAGVGLKLKKLE